MTTPLPNNESQPTPENDYARRLDLTDFSERMDRLRETVGTHVVGQNRSVRLILTALLADGHVLLEGVPGVAKTLMAKTVARLLDAKFRRVQFTPDLMPTDVLGTTIFNLASQQFDFHPGPVFTQLLLVDEINRAPAKTQAALFEVMEERQVTLDGNTRALDPFYMVIATQNPVEQEGTYRLPEAQLDRFLLKIDMGYPTPDEELEILSRYNAGRDLRDVSALTPILSADRLLEMRRLLPEVVVDERMLRYITGLTAGTRTSPLIDLGASPRATVALLRCAKAAALLSGRDFVIPDDVKEVAPAVLCHRLTLTPDAEMNGYTAARIVGTLLESIEIPN